MKLLRTEVTSDRFTGELSQQYRKSWADAAELEVRTAHVQTVIPCDAAGPALRELLAMIQAIVVSEIGDVRRDFRSIPCPQ